MTKAQQQKFLKLVQGLNDLLVDIRKKTPNANYYLADDSLNIISAEAHLGTFTSFAKHIVCVRLL